MFYESILILACVFLSTTGEPLFDPCKKDDLQCLSFATDSFTSKTYRGFPDYGIEPIDPLIIPSLEILVDSDLGLLYKFKSVNVTGLKNLKTTDFKMNTDQKSVLLKLKAELQIVGDVEIVLTKAKKTFKGLYSASISVIETSKYNYSFKTVNNTEYFEVGPETNSCEIAAEPTVTLGNELQNSLNKDKDAANLKQAYEDNKVNLRKKTLCKIGDVAFKTVINNLRMAGRSFPKSYFFVDI